MNLYYRKISLNPSLPKRGIIPPFGKGRLGGISLNYVVIFLRLLFQYNFSFSYIPAFLTLVLLLITALPSAAKSQDQANKKVIIYFFRGSGCPHCEHEKIFLDTLSNKYPRLVVESFEVWNNQSNRSFFQSMTKSAGMKSTSVPVTFIDKEVFIGFSENTARDIESRIRYCIENPCIDPVERLDKPFEQEVQKTVDLPFVGKVDSSKFSLPVLTIILGGLDSFNPCAFFVLFFLLSLMIHAKSRKRMLLIGGTFVFFSGFIYFIFMAAWLNIFMIAGQIIVITSIAGVVALAVAGINIKDFFFFKKGVSLSIPEKAKPRLFERMRNLLKSTSLSSIMAGTVVLAVAANTYELLCTAGFPMVFTRILTLNDLTTLQYYLYLALYNFIYVIPLVLIVLVFTITLGAKKLTEWQGRKLKLLSGLMMFFLGLILLIKPALLNNVFVAVGLLASALLIFSVVVLITKKLRPDYATG